MFYFALRLALGKGTNRNKTKALAWIIMAESNFDQIEVGKTDKFKTSIAEIKFNLKSDLKQKEIENSQELAVQLQKKIEKNRDTFEP